MSKKLGANAQLYLKIGKIFDKLMDMDWEDDGDHKWIYFPINEGEIKVHADFGNQVVSVINSYGPIESFDFDSETLVKDVIKRAKELM